MALCHVGDSRAYLLRDGSLTQLTRDQTFVQLLVDQGVITREQARRHPRKNVVLQALEAEHLAAPDVGLVDVRLGDRLLVCSDGLTDLVEDDQIRVCLEQPDAEEAARAPGRRGARGRRGRQRHLRGGRRRGRSPAGGRRRPARARSASPHLVVDPAAVHALG